MTIPCQQFWNRNSQDNFGRRATERPASEKLFGNQALKHVRELSPNDNLRLTIFGTPAPTTTVEGEPLWGTRPSNNFGEPAPETLWEINPKKNSGGSDPMTISYQQFWNADPQDNFGRRTTEAPDKLWKVNPQDNSGSYINCNSRVKLVA